MNRDTSNLTRPIVEALYSEALVLADDVRAVFALGTKEPRIGESTKMRLALSIEGLKTTTRMMHLLAWLLNQRAYFSGELSESQVRNFGVLPKDRAPDAGQLELLEPETRDLIDETVALYSRVERLDNAWRIQAADGSTVRAFQQRIGEEFGRA